MACLWQVYPCRFRDSMYCLHDNGTVVFRVRKLMPSSAGRLLLEQVWSILPALELLPLNWGVNMQFRQMDQIWFRFLLLHCLYSYVYSVIEGQLSTWGSVSLELDPFCLRFVECYRPYTQSSFCCNYERERLSAFNSHANRIQLDLVEDGDGIEAWHIEHRYTFRKMGKEKKACQI